MPASRLSYSLSLVAALVVACRPDTPAPPERDASEPARRAAQAFVHCIEQDAAQCVRGSSHDGAWDAFSLLGWLGSGSPTAILSAFSRELEHHADARNVQRRFVARVENYAPVVRGAGCQASSMLAMSELLPKVRGEAEARLGRLGLWSAEVSQVVDGLANEATDGLHDGYLARIDCREDPWQMYLATAADSGRYTVVGLVPALPDYLGGEGQSREVSRQVQSSVLGTAGSVAPLQEGVVHPWLPFPVEEY